MISPETLPNVLSRQTHPRLTTECAVAVVRGDSKVTGTVTFVQESESAPTTITWDISGNDANAKRGMHIHTFGDNTNGCTSAGPHCESSSARLLVVDSKHA